MERFYMLKGFFLSFSFSFYLSEKNLFPKTHDVCFVQAHARILMVVYLKFTFAFNILVAFCISAFDTQLCSTLLQTHIYRYAQKQKTKPLLSLIQINRFVRNHRQDVFYPPGSCVFIRLDHRKRFAFYSTQLIVYIVITDCPLNISNVFR